MFFLLFGRGLGPRPNSNKKNTSPPKQQKTKKKKKKRHRPFRQCVVFFVFLFGRVGVFIFCCLGGGRVLFFAVWAGGMFLFCCLGGGVFFVCCLGGGMFLFLLFGPGACFFLLFGRGTGVHSLTRLPGSSLSDPTTKETEQPKKKHGFQPEYLPISFCDLFVVTDTINIRRVCNHDICIV